MTERVLAKGALSFFSQASYSAHLCQPQPHPHSIFHLKSLWLCWWDLVPQDKPSAPYQKLKFLICPIFWVPSSHSLLAMLSWSSTGKFISVSSPPSFKCILYPHGLISEKHSRQLTIFWYQPMNTLSLPLPGGISVLEGTDEVRDNDSRYNF